jgi:glycosyltransferase involved in cell wall biosynthesis
MKKKILLLSDDIRTYTGVGIISKQLVLKTAHLYDWVQIATTGNPEEAGTAVDVSQSIDKLTGVSGSYVRLYPISDYGNETILRGVIKQESPDIILCFTDPRFWTWLHKLERELRQTTPLAYYHVWDNYPYPHFNIPAYDSCDWIGCISKLTYDVVRTVCPYREEWQTSYVPHGVCSDTFRPVDESDKLTEWKSQLIPSSAHFDYTILYNNANLRRKQIPNLLVSYKAFCDSLPKEEQKKVGLILHTNPENPTGCNVYDIVNSLGDGYNILVSNIKLTDVWMNRLYNIVDVTINIASAEGFGLSTLESMMSGTPIIANQTGGLVDQCGAGYEGKWAYTIKPSIKNTLGSQTVPYIYEDICSRQSVVDGFNYWYTTPPEERRHRGLLGRAHGKTNFSLDIMTNSFINGIDTTLEKFTPRSRFDCTLVDNTNPTCTFLDKDIVI